MFPSSVAVVAIYVIMQKIGEVFPGIGLGTLAGLLLVYLGGAMGINAWLMKGFFDTIPKDLDESAKVDGATHLQIYRKVILPLARAHPRRRVPHLVPDDDERTDPRPEPAARQRRQLHAGGRSLGLRQPGLRVPLGTLRRRIPRSARSQP